MDWAYDFTCGGRSIEAVLAALNATGPWQWQLRDNQVYGDYLACRPQEHVWLRIHEYPCTGIGTFAGLHDKGFTALLQIDAGSAATQSEIDRAFRRLLQAIDAADLTAIEPYD